MQAHRLQSREPSLPVAGPLPRLSVRARGMSRESRRSASQIARAVARSGRTIYDSLETRPDLFYDILTLEEHLRARLLGLNLAYPIRTRSRVVKQAVCRVLGYPVPPKFIRTRPRFPGQDLDVYVQKADNVQIWN